MLVLGEGHFGKLVLQQVHHLLAELKVLEIRSPTKLPGPLKTHPQFDRLRSETTPHIFLENASHVHLKGPKSRNGSN